VLPAPSGPASSGKIDFKALAGDRAKAPWHFKLLVVALVVYLTWRFVQLVQAVL
jgi:uncharacterized membrane-anchored protein